MVAYSLAALAALSLLSHQTAAQGGGCASVQTPSYPKPVVGAGYVAQLVVTGLSRPRSIKFDGNGALLVVQQGQGIQRITFNDNGATCLSVKDNKELISASELNHAIELSDDGKTLFASSADAVYSWAYDSGAGTLSSDRKTLVQGMRNSDHVSRTLLLSKKSKGTLLVSRGSAENMDMQTRQESSGRSQIRAFDIDNLPDGKPYSYTDGKMIGWGLRNSVGVAEHPVTGGVFSVENSADNIERRGIDVHQDNPGEELNFHGFLNGSTENQGGNYGYPDCFAVWDTNLPDSGNMKVGSQFSLDPGSEINDEKCAKDYVAPRLTFEAHTAPLDLMFTPDGSEAYVSFHGSWNRDEPAGYKLSVIPFSDGQPTEPPDSTKGARDILSNGDLKSCPGSCFRPVGLAMDKAGRIFMSSDSTGEIWVLQKAEMTALGEPSGTSTGGGTLITSTDAAGSGGNPNVAPRSGRSRPGSDSLLLAFAAVALSLIGGAMVVAA